MENIINISKYELSGGKSKDGWIFTCYHCRSYTSNSFILGKTNYELYICKKCYRIHKIADINANEKKLLCFINKDLHKKYLDYLDYCNVVINRNICIV